MNLFKNLLAICVGLAIVANSTLSAFAAFSDVNSGHKYFDSISFIESEGVVNGYADGSYKPEQTLNRAELLKILIEARYTTEFTAYGVEGCFDDVPGGQWFTPYICFAKDRGIVQGYSDGLFRPEQNVNFAEAVKMVVETFEYVAIFTANDPWYKGYIDAASSMNLIPLDIYQFDQFLNRGQMADMIARTIKQTTGEDFAGLPGSYVSPEDPVLNFNVPSAYKNKKLSTTEFQNCCANSLKAELSADYVGDGQYTLREGDIVQASNGVYLKIGTIKGNIMSMFFYDSNRLPMNLYKRWTALFVGRETYFSDYGVIVDYEPLESNPNYFASTDTQGPKIEVTISSDYFENAAFGQMMFDKCQGANCASKYSSYLPLEGEVAFTNGRIVLILPETKATYGNDFLLDAEACFNEIQKHIIIESKPKIIPIRMTVTDSTMVVATTNGIEYPISANFKYTNDSAGNCNDLRLAHEMVDYLVQPLPMTGLYGEGLSTYIDNKIINNVEPLQLIYADMIIFEGYGSIREETQMGYYLGYTDTGNIAIYDSNKAGIVSIYADEGYGSYFWHGAQPVYVFEVTEKDDTKIRLNIYRGQSSMKKINCIDGGYEVVPGWNKGGGLFLINTPLQNVDSEKSFAWMMFKNYLTTPYPFASTYKGFFSTSACFWNEVETKSPGAVKSIVSWIDEVRDSGEYVSVFVKLKELIGDEKYASLLLNFGIEDESTTYASGGMEVGNAGYLYP